MAWKGNGRPCELLDGSRLTDPTEGNTVQCHNCNKDIQKGTSAVRRIKTGTYSTGANYFRSVNLCARCLAEMNASNKIEGQKKLLLVGAALLFIVGVAVYFLFYR